MFLLQGVNFWASRRETLTFNDWQQGVSQIRTLFKDGPNLPQAGPGYTAVVSALWKEVMGDIHGPDWRQRMVRTIPKGSSSSRPLPPVPKAKSTASGNFVATMSRAGDGGGAEVSSPAAESIQYPPPPDVRAVSLQGDSAVTALAQWKGPPGPRSASGRLERETSAPFAFQVAPPSRAGGTDPGSRYRFLQGMPPVTRIKGGVPAQPVRQPVAPQAASIISYEAHQSAEAFQVEGSEDSEDGYERFERLKVALEEAGLGGEEVDLTLQIE